MEKLPTEYLDLGDVRIAYREHGAGPALILLHGNSASKAMFSKYQTVHFATFRTIAVDSRGHGETVSIDTQYSIHQYSEDVIGLCRAKGISQAFVIGYSDGGNIALFLAKNAPDIFKKIVAISPNYLVSGTIPADRVGPSADVPHCFGNRQRYVPIGIPRVLAKLHGRMRRNRVEQRPPCPGSVPREGEHH